VEVKDDSDGPGIGGHGGVGDAPGRGRTMLVNIFVWMFQYRNVRMLKL
jgi:hypothetical protein